MYRISIVVALCVCLAFVAITGCKQAERKPTGAEAAQTKATTYTATDVEREAVKREAKEAYLEGVRARQANDLKAARDAFARAVQLDPEYIEALKALTDVKVALGEAAPPAAEAAMGAQRLEAQLQQTRQEIRTLMGQARTLFQKEQFQDSINALEDALGLMNWASKAYNMDFGAERPEAEELLKNARVQQEVFAKAQEAEQRKAAQQALEDELRKQVESRHQAAAQLLATAREELAKKNFSQASSYVNRAIAADPGNVEAMELSNIIVEQRINFDRERTILQKDMAWRASFQAMEIAGIPKVEGAMTWPDKARWEEITQKRQQRSEQEQKVFQPTAEQEKINKILDETKVRLLNIEEQPFPSAVKTLMKQFNAVPIVIHPEAMSKLALVNVGVSRPTETSLRAALEYLLARIPKDAGEFSYVIRDEAVLITLKGAEESRSLIIYPVQDLLRKPVGFKAKGIKFSKEDLFRDVITDTGAGAYTETGYADEASDPKLNGGEDFRETTDMLKDLIVNTIGGTDVWNVGGETTAAGALSTIDFRRGNMYINATEPVHQEVQRILEHLRYTDDVLVTLETRFLKVEESLLEEIGVDLTGFPTATQQARANQLGLNFTDPFLTGVLSDVANAPTSGLFFAKRGAGVGFIQTGTNGQLIFLPSGVPTGDALGLNSQNILDSSLASALSGATQGLTAGFSFRPGNSNMNFVLKALENSSRSSILAAPKVTTYNLQTAYISIRKEQTFISGIKDVTLNPPYPPSYQLKLSRLNTGIQLTVRPTVTWDRKYVILEVIAVSISGSLPPGKRQTLDLTPPAPTQSATTLTPVQPTFLVEFEFPVIDMQNIATTVIIPNGGTVILGGLSQMQRIEGGATTPLLGDIPLLKFFFSTEGSTVTRTSLVILIRAEITVVPEQERRFLEES